MTRKATTVLIYADVAAAYDYLSTTFDLTPGGLDVDGDGRVIHGEVGAGDSVLWLHPPGEGYRPPEELGGVTSMTVIEVDDVDLHYRAANERGAHIIEAPADRSYGMREYGARDPEGHVWYFCSRSEGA